MIVKYLCSEFIYRLENIIFLILTIDWRVCILICKVKKSDGSEKTLEDLYMLHITHRKEEPLSIDYLTQHNKLKYKEYKPNEIRELIIQFNGESTLN